MGHSREEPDFCSWPHFWRYVFVFVCPNRILVNCKATCVTHYFYFYFLAIRCVLLVMYHVFTLLNCLFLLLLFDNSLVNDTKFPKDYDYSFFLHWFNPSALKQKVVLKLDWIYQTLTQWFCVLFDKLHLQYCLVIIDYFTLD